MADVLTGQAVAVSVCSKKLVFRGGCELTILSFSPRVKVLSFLLALGHPGVCVSPSLTVLLPLNNSSN